MLLKVAALPAAIVISKYMENELIDKAAAIIKTARRCIAFTGAGVSVESGIPPFRGPGGLWSKYDPNCLDIDTFIRQPDEAWDIIKEIFYDFFGKARPNPAHEALAKLEKMGKLAGVITQNIDNLHQEAGSVNVIEYHGNSHRLTCLSCQKKVAFTPSIFDEMPPRCRECGGLLKPDFVFFGEMIPLRAQRLSTQETAKSDVWLVIGTTGEVYPAASLPLEAKQRGKIIIEVNLKPSNYTASITDIFLQGKAGEIVKGLCDRITG